MSPRAVMASATAAYDASAEGEGTIREDSILVTFERFSAGGLTMRGTAFCAGQSHVQGKCCEQSAFNMFRLHDISTGQYRDTTAQIQGDGLTVVLNILPSSERLVSPISANDAVHLQLEFNIDSVPQCALYNSARPQRTIVGDAPLRARSHTRATHPCNYPGLAAQETAAPYLGPAALKRV
jgi:hypothetical protein